MKIDPRWVSTPIGAAIGVALTRKVMDKKDLTLKNQAIGGGLGAGAGYLTGELLRKDPLEVSAREGEDDRAAAERFWGESPRTDYASDSEIAITDRINPQFAGIKPEDEGTPLVNNFRLSQAKRLGPVRSQYNALGQRIGFYKKKAKQARTPEERDMYLDAVRKNSEQRRVYSKQLFLGQITHGALYPAKSTIKNLWSLLGDTANEL